MKLLNCTNQKSAKLRQYGLVDKGIAAEGQLLLPGKSIEVKDADKMRIEAEYAHLFEIGALGWDLTKPLPKAVVELKADVPVEASLSMKESTKKKG